MEYTRLGNSGLEVSRLCLGCMNFGGPTDEETAIRIMAEALEAGMMFWDTANVYNQGESERLVGKALRQLGARDQVVLASKVTNPMGQGPNQKGSGRRHIMQQIDASLQRLQTDWIDLYQLHRPDFNTPLEETLEAMNDCVRAGKVRYWGTSLFPSWRMAEATRVTEARHWAKPISEQGPYNIVDRRIETERLHYMQEAGWGLLPWSPLGGGILTGRYTEQDRERPPEDSRLGHDASYTRAVRSRMTSRALAVGQEVAGMAQELGYTPAQFALAWVLRRPGVTSPIIGPRTLEHFRGSLPALEIEIPETFQNRIDELVPPGSAVSDFHSTAHWFAGPCFE